MFLRIVTEIPYPVHGTSVRRKMLCGGAVFYAVLECLDHVVILPCRTLAARRFTSATPYIPALQDGVLRRN